MEILENLISEHGSKLMSVLTESGFSPDQAEAFLPSAAQGISDAIGGEGFADLLGGDPGSATSAIASKIDIDGIASGAGIDPSLATEGLAALIPKVLEMLSAEGGSVSSLLGNGGIGGLAGMAGKLFNR